MCHITSNVYDENANVIKQFVQDSYDTLPHVKVVIDTERLVNPYPEMGAFRNAVYHYSTFVRIRNRYNENVCYVPVGWEKHPEWPITKALTFKW